MRILALEPYFGGSHEAFLAGWTRRSRHDWTLLTLPANHWKWRMRHAAVTLARMTHKKSLAGGQWDLIFCSDMLNLAELIALAPPPVRSLPAVAYFHENQLTYPDRHARERDVHFGLSNLITALAATSVWFNTQFHLDTFLAALRDLLQRMPDHRDPDNVDRIAARSAVHPPGIDAPPPRGPRRPGPIRILWAARWERDKDPQTFFDAVERLHTRGVEFRLDVVGQQFRSRPAVFDRAKQRLADRIGRWGYQPSREDYQAALAEADVVVSTARHEFFGISICEAIAAGAYPVLPRRLAYPEVLGGAADEFFYDGGADELADRLAEIARRVDAGRLWDGDPTRAARAVQRFHWTTLAPQLDDALQTVAAAS